MTTYKRIWLLIGLLLGAGKYLATAQAGAGLSLSPEVCAITAVLSHETSYTGWKGEAHEAYYHVAVLSHQFRDALESGGASDPLFLNARRLLGIFPDTLFWQEREKRAMERSLEKARQAETPGDWPQVIFVRKGAEGDGSSWKNAYGDLQQALTVVQPGMEIWVAQGVYTPTQTGDRTAAFQIPDSVRLYGGFSGHELARHERDWQEHLTVLSGEIGEEGPADNAHTVVYTRQVGRATLVDGFVITGAFADGVQELGDRARCGGGWFNDGAGGFSGPTVANCLFVQNYARDGAAFYNFGREGVANPSFIDCQFVENRSDLDGGALFADGRGGQVEISIEHCLFLGNRANYGSAVSSRSEGGKVLLRIHRSVFESNVAYVRKLIHDGDDHRPMANRFVVFKRSSRFADNVSVVGEDENTSEPITSAKEKELARGEISFLDF